MRDSSAIVRAMELFQPTSDITAGRCDMSTVPAYQITLVSTHVRHHCRTMPQSISFRALSNLFQPTSDITAGRCRRRVKTSMATRTVSTHVRHHCRTMLGSLLAVLDRHEFQPTSDITAGRCFAAKPRAVILDCFNPRPTSLPDDAVVRHTPTVTAIGFNPRPTSLPDDARAPRILSRTLKVSTHVRHHCRTMHLSSGSCSWVRLFQPTSDITAGRCPRSIALDAQIRTFQPTSDITAGRCV